MYGKIKKGLFTVVGAGIMGASLDLFLVPSHIAAGGVGGLATIVNHLTGISVGILILLINIPIFIVGTLNFSRKFLFYSLLGTLSLSVSTQACRPLPMTSFWRLFSAAPAWGSVLGLCSGLAEPPAARIFWRWCSKRGSRHFPSASFS